MGYLQEVHGNLDGEEGEEEMEEPDYGDEGYEGEGGEDEQDEQEEEGSLDIQQIFEENKKKGDLRALIGSSPDPQEPPKVVKPVPQRQPPPADHAFGMRNPFLPPPSAASPSLPPPITKPLARPPPARVIPDSQPPARVLPVNQPPARVIPVTKPPLGPSEFDEQNQPAIDLLSRNH